MDIVDDPPMTPAEIYPERIDRPGGLSSADDMSPEDALKEAQQLRAARLAKAAAAEKNEVERRMAYIQKKIDELPALCADGKEVSLAIVRLRRNLDFILKYYAEGGELPKLSKRTIGFFVQDGGFIDSDKAREQRQDPNNPIHWEPLYGHHA